MFSDSFPDYKVFVFMPNIVLIILNIFFFESLEICKKLQASQNWNLSLHLHSLQWFMSSFSPVQARQQTKCLVSSSLYSRQSSLLPPGLCSKIQIHSSPWVHSHVLHKVPVTFHSHQLLAPARLIQAARSTASHGITHIP